MFPVSSIEEVFKSLKTKLGQRDLELEMKDIEMDLQKKKIEYLSKKVSELHGIIKNNPVPDQTRSNLIKPVQTRLNLTKLDHLDNSQLYHSNLSMKVSEIIKNNPELNHLDNPELDQTRLNLIKLDYLNNPELNHLDNPELDQTRSNWIKLDHSKLDLQQKTIVEQNTELQKLKVHVSELENKVNSLSIKLKSAEGKFKEAQFKIERQQKIIEKQREALKTQKHSNFKSKLKRKHHNMKNTTAVQIDEEHKKKTKEKEKTKSQGENIEPETLLKQKTSVQHADVLMSDLATESGSSDQKEHTHDQEISKEEKTISILQHSDSDFDARFDDSGNQPLSHSSSTFDGNISEIKSKLKENKETTLHCQMDDTSYSATNIFLQEQECRSKLAQVPIMDLFEEFINEVTNDHKEVNVVQSNLSTQVENTKLQNMILTNKEDISEYSEYKNRLSANMSDSKRPNKGIEDKDGAKLNYTIADDNLRTENLQDDILNQNLIRTPKTKNIEDGLQNKTQNRILKKNIIGGFQNRALKKNVSQDQCTISSQVSHKSGLPKNHDETVHKKLRHFKCENCSKTYGQPYRLKNHVDIVHKKLKPFDCKICLKTFGQSIHLKNHENAVHKKLRPFQCKICSNSFARKCTLYVHLKTTHKQ